MFGKNLHFPLFFACTVVVLFLGGVVLWLNYSFGVFRYFFTFEPKHKTSLYQTYDKNIQDNKNFSLKKMLNLIQASQRAKYLEYRSYFTGKSSKVPTVTLHDLHQDLLHQRVLLRNYILDCKGMSQTQLPHRKRQTFNYYLQVLDTQISEVESLIEKRTQNIN